MRESLFRLSVVILLALVVVGAVFIGYNHTANKPIVSGKLVSVTIWEKPVQRPGETGQNSGFSPDAGSQVDVYESFIVVTSPAGERIVSLHGWYTNLRLK